MFKPDGREEETPPRSLLSVARSSKAAARPSEPPASVSHAKSSAAERHRLARSRREAVPSPLLGALAAGPGREVDQPPVDAMPAEARKTTATPTDVPRQAPPPIQPSMPLPPPDPRTMAADDGDEWRPLIDPLKIWGGIVRSRWIILATTIAGAAIGVALALSTPKKYESVAELLVDPRDIKISDRNVTEGGLPSDATLAIVENQVRVLTSGNVLAKVVDELNLTADPEFNGQEERLGIGSAISGLRSLLSRGSGGEGDVRRTLAIRNLAESLSVVRGGKTFVVSISAVTKSPEKSALIANTLTTTFLESYGEIQSDTAGRASDELSARLAELQKGVEAAERKVESYKVEHDLVDAQGRLITDDEILKLNDQLTIARARTIELNARAASARDLDPDAVIGGNLPEQIASPVMGELRTQYAVAKQEVERLSVRLGPRHPERQAAEAQLAGARDSLSTELRRIGSSIQVDLKRAVQLEQDLASRLAQLKARQGYVSDDLVTLRELEREAAAKRAVYESFLLRARETNEQRGINTANMSVISVAQPPLDPLGPSRGMITIAATVLGFMAGVGLGGARGAIDSLRGGGAPLTPRRPRPPAPTRGRRDDDIDRIMRAATGQRTAPAPRSPAPAASEPQPAGAAALRPKQTVPEETSVRAAGKQPAEPVTKDTAMNPQAYPYPPAHQPQQPWPAQQWYEQQAAIAAHQQALYQAWVASQQSSFAQAAYPQPPQHAAPYWPPVPQPYAQPGYPPQHIPVNMQPPQPWPGQPQFAGYAGWRPPAEPAHAAQPARPQPHEATSALDEIRDSLREFRDAVRDLADARSRGRA